MDPRHERLARNESLFREVNERISELTVHQVGEPEPRFVCECSRTECSELMDLTLDEYEAVRADPARFALVRGHEIPEIERVVDEHAATFVVEKIGDAAVVAAQLDPRAL